MNQKTNIQKIDEQTKAGLHLLTETHEKLILKAWSDPEFKKALIANPAKAVEEAVGIKVPGFINVKVLEETADTRFITIPYQAESGDRPLADEELESVAGGSSRAKKDGNRSWPFCY
jgi:hypothetical protein